MSTHNIQRLSEDVKREISSSLRDIKDSRVSGGIVSVSRCEVTNDLSYCRVFISTLAGGEKTNKAAECLQNASGFFKKRINQRIKMRKIPELIFIPDNSLDYYEKINSIIHNLDSKSKQNDNIGDKEDVEIFGTDI